MFRRLGFLRRRTVPAYRLGEESLGQGAIEEILRTPCEKDTFEVIEDLNRPLARGVTWIRKQLAWTDGSTGEDFGLCVNTLWVAREVAYQVRPSVAAALPELVNFEHIERAYWQTNWAGDAQRKRDGRKQSRLYLNMRELTCARSGAPRGPWEDLDALQERVRRGEWKEEDADLLPAMSPVVRRVDGSPLEVVRYLPAHQPSWIVQAYPKVLAATNGGFFLNFPEEYEDGRSSLHQPVGALYANDRLYMPPWIERPAALEWRDGVRGIELLGPENLALSVAGEPGYLLATGRRKPIAAATVWRNFDGPLPAMKEGLPAVDLVFSGAGLAKVSLPGESACPIGGAIIRLLDKPAAPWLEWMENPSPAPFPAWELALMSSRNVPLEWAMAAGPKLLNDGRPIESAELLKPWAAGEFRHDGAPPSRFPYDANVSRGPRTAIGLTADEDWMLVVVDGRADLSHSVGLTLSELARLMRQLGCYHALNLDGGGSSVMAIEGVGQLDQLKPGLASYVANVPCDPDSQERIVPVALTVVGV